MPSVQLLKKKLKSICATQKISKAMKTVSAAKFSKLSGIYGKYSAYSDTVLQIKEQYGDSLSEFLPKINQSAPAAIVVMASNRGMCGGFNNEVFAFASDIIEKEKDALIFTVGKKAEAYFRSKLYEAFVFSDEPDYGDSNRLFDRLFGMLSDGEISAVRLVYPEYINTMTQNPVMKELFEKDSQNGLQSDIIWVPDRQTVLKSVADKLYRSVLYTAVLQTALGAQASTLLTMRSAFDTATQYSMALETEINRTRQSIITSDVIETSSESTQEGN